MSADCGETFYWNLTWKTFQMAINNFYQSLVSLQIALLKSLNLLIDSLESKLSQITQNRLTQYFLVKTIFYLLQHDKNSILVQRVHNASKAWENCTF